MKEKIAELKKLLGEADKLAAELIKHEVIGKIPQAIAIRGAISNGALAHFEALEKLADEAGKQATPAATKK